MQDPYNNSSKLNNSDVSVNPTSIFRRINIHHRCTENIVSCQFHNSFGQGGVWFDLNFWTQNKNLHAEN